MPWNSSSATVVHDQAPSKPFGTLARGSHRTPGSYDMVQALWSFFRLCEMAVHDPSAAAHRLRRYRHECDSRHGGLRLARHQLHHFLRWQVTYIDVGCVHDWDAGLPSRHARQPGRGGTSSAGAVVTSNPSRSINRRHVYTMQSQRDLSTQTTPRVSGLFAPPDLRRSRGTDTALSRRHDSLA